MINHMYNNLYGCSIFCRYITNFGHFVVAHGFTNYKDKTLNELIRQIKVTFPNANKALFSGQTTNQKSHLDAFKKLPNCNYGRVVYNLNSGNNVQCFEVDLKEPDNEE